MSTPTEEQINHLQSLLDAGTPGHWDGQAGYLTMEDKVLLLGWDKCDEDLENSENNCLLIAKLHNLVPDLLEAARENLRLREERENWRVSSVCREKQLRIEELERENGRLKEALEYYSHSADYHSPLTGGMGKLYFDCGEMARKALGKEVA